MKNCQDCGATEKIQYHHTSYNPSITIPLCISCHEKRHGHSVGNLYQSNITAQPVNSFVATVRRQRTNLPGLYGLIRSKQLAPFLEKNVIVTIELAPEPAPKKE